MKDCVGYLERLDKSMNEKEKLFFISKINIHDYDCIVDFGGANGSLLAILQNKYGYKGKCVLVEKNTQFTTVAEYKGDICRSVSKARLAIDKCRKILLILSSVLHEITIEHTLRSVISLAEECHTVVARDMYFSPFAPVKTFVLKEHWEKIVQRAEENGYSEIIPYRQPSGSGEWVIAHLAGLCELLLKIDYVENRDTEIKEEYFCNNISEVLERLLLRGYTASYVQEYCLPYIQEKVRQQFGHILFYPTHMKWIVSRA